LEARWAVFFDTLGVEYQYEPEGYNLDGIWYLPDFWLPKQRYWIEIKAEKPEEATENKLYQLASESKAVCAAILWGQPWIPDDVWGIENDGHYLVYPHWDNRYLWCECPICGFLGLQFEGRAARLECQCVVQKAKAAGAYEDRCHNYRTERIDAGYIAARQARFEHGERGTIVKAWKSIE